MTDWPALIARLERRKLRHIDIAAACDRSESWVGRLKRREFREPPYSIGKKLIDLDRGFTETHNPQVESEERA